MIVVMMMKLMMMVMTKMKMVQEVVDSSTILVVVCLVCKKPTRLWWVSCTLRVVSGAYRCHINCNKSCRDDQLSVIHFLPVAYFGLWPCCSADSVKYVCLI